MPANEPVAGSRSFSAVRFVREDNSEYRTPVYFVPSDSADGGGSTLAPVLMQAQRSKVREWMGGENGTGPSPALKRVRSPMLQRDSLKSRYSPGRPGSRRHRRWMNDNHLREELDEEDLKEAYALDYHSALSDLFYGDNMKKWEEFCAMDEEEQRKYLKGVKGNATKPPPKIPDDPRVLFERLERKVKQMLKRGAGRDFLAAFEPRLTAMLRGQEDPGSPVAREDSESDDGFTLVDSEGGPGFKLELVRTRVGVEVALDDAMHRLVAHAVCHFHSLSSSSRPDPASGKKQLVIVFPRAGREAPRPRMLLSEFLDAEEQQGQEQSFEHAA